MSAQAKADHMAQNMYFAHDAPDGTTPWYFIDQSGYQYNSAGENLALTNQSASSVVDGWFNSPGHYANMMSSTFVEVGYGIAYVPTFTYEGTTYNNVYLVAAHYGQPVLTTQAPSPPQNQPETAVQSAQVTPETSTPEPPAPIQPSEPTTSTVQEAPTGFEPEPANTSRSGELVQTAENTMSIPTSYAIAGIGIGASLIIIGSWVEIRRLMHHQPLLPRLH
jgi:hypothetical protein